MPGTSKGKTNGKSVKKETKPYEKAKVPETTSDVSAEVEPVEFERKPDVLAGKPKDRESMRKFLVQKREEIVREAKAEIKKYISGENRQLVESVMDEGDLSVVDLSEDISLKQLSTHREKLIKTDAAIRKLEEGTYGLCEECGDEINEARLKILPFAIFCRDCQERRELIEKIEKDTR